MAPGPNKLITREDVIVLGDALFAFLADCPPGQVKWLITELVERFEAYQKRHDRKALAAELRRKSTNDGKAEKVALDIKTLKECCGGHFAPLFQDVSSTRIITSDDINELLHALFEFVDDCAPGHVMALADQVQTRFERYSKMQCKANRDALTAELRAKLTFDKDKEAAQSTLLIKAVKECWGGHFAPLFQDGEFESEDTGQASQTSTTRKTSSRDPVSSLGTSQSSSSPHEATVSSAPFSPSASQATVTCRPSSPIPSRISVASAPSSWSASPTSRTSTFNATSELQGRQSNQRHSRASVKPTSSDISTLARRARRGLKKLFTERHVGGRKRW
jgi:hypothetical protein